MNRGISLYLDATRFAAAFIVFLGHASSQGASGGMLWPVAQYGSAAVMTFFVLSGFVIAHVSHERENNPRDYTIARISRLYSIVIPALVLTLISQHIVRSIDPTIYYDMPWSGSGGDSWLHFLSTITFTNQFWFWPNPPMEPVLNNPFWSLSFEAAYYVAAGLIFFLKGWARVLSITVLCGLAGPAILSLAPIWFMGMGIYYLKDRIRLSKRVGYALALAGLILLVIAPLIHPFTGDIRMGPHSLLGQYYEGIAFSIHLLGILQLGHLWERALGWCAKTVRWFGSLTFALYLFHWPIMLTLTAAKIGPIESWQQRAYLLLVPLLVVATFGYWCERQKTTIKGLLNSVFWGAAAAPPPTNRQA